MQKILEKEGLKEFLINLSKNYEIIIPTREKNTKFKKLEKNDEIYLEKITQVPVKEFFLPENETILTFNKNKIIEKKSKPKKRIIFGLRLCDLNALKVLDKVMKDPLYINKRKNTLLIGLYCENPDDKCFCNSMELNPPEEVCDLFFYPDKKNFYISEFTEKGKKLTKDLKEIKKDRIKKLKNKKELKNKDIENEYQNEIWKTNSEDCLSCSACTVYCPTCNCFDIEDNLDISLNSGTRKRKQMSCQLKEFTEVAGGKVFRDSRLSRFKHFVYHKIVYYKKTHNRYMCVGCGRCLRVCPTKIDWVDTINILKEFKK